MKNSLRKAALVVPGLVAAALLSTAGAATAAPADKGTEPAQITSDCSHKHSNKDSGEGRATTTLRYRVGPHTRCAAPGQVAKGTLIYYHCWTYGDWVGEGQNRKRTWTWGRIDGTQTAGWFADAYLSDGGASASNKC